MGGKKGRGREAREGAAGERKKLLPTAALDASAGSTDAARSVTFSDDLERGLGVTGRDDKNKLHSSGVGSRSGWWRWLMTSKLALPLVFTVAAAVMLLAGYEYPEVVNPAVRIAPRVRRRTMGDPRGGGMARPSRVNPPPVCCLCMMRV